MKTKFQYQLSGTRIVGSYYDSDLAFGGGTVRFEGEITNKGITLETYDDIGHRDSLSIDLLNHDDGKPRKSPLFVRDALMQLLGIIQNTKPRKA